MHEWKESYGTFRMEKSITLTPKRRQKMQQPTLMAIRYIFILTNHTADLLSLSKE